MNEKITLEKLAQMIGNGFIQVDKRFEMVDKRFEKLENKLQKLSNETDRRFNEFDRRLFNIENDVKVILGNKMGYVYNFEMKALEKRVKRLEEKVK